MISKLTHHKDVKEDLEIIIRLLLQDALGTEHLPLKEQRE